MLVNPVGDAGGVAGPAALLPELTRTQYRTPHSSAVASRSRRAPTQRVRRARQLGLEDTPEFVVPRGNDTIRADPKRQVVENGRSAAADPTVSRSWPSQDRPEQLFMLVGDPLPVVHLAGSALRRRTKLSHPCGSA